MFSKTVHGRALIVAGLAASILPIMASPSAAAQPQGRTLYAAHLFSNDITTFTIGADGKLARVGERTPAGRMPRSLVFAPDGRMAYILNGADRTITTYAVDERGGLSERGEPVSTRGTESFGMAISPDGTALYAANIGDGTVSALAIGPDRRPRLIGDPVLTGAEAPRGVAVSPDGRFVFVAHGRPGSGSQDVVVTFAVQPGGGLVRIGRPVPVGSGGSGIDVTPGGGLLYVTSIGSDLVFGFRVGRDGSLSPVPGSPFPTHDFPEEAAVTPDGRHLYVSGPGSMRPDLTRAMSGFAIQRDGSLRPVPGSPFRAGNGPLGVTPTPDGRRLYVGNFDSHDVSGFAIGDQGSLRTIEGSPFPTGGSNPTFQGVTVRPNQGPVASFSVRAGRTSAFDASASSDSDGHVARYDWDFGDGTVQRDGGPRPTHVYQRPGTFRVTLVVTDDEGCSVSLVFTGQSPLCNGSGAARTSQTVEVE